jgi:hypothetical protein
MWCSGFCTKLRAPPWGTSPLRGSLCSYHEASGEKCVPRAALMDLKPGAIDNAALNRR